MTMAQVSLSDQDRDDLQAMAKETGKTEQELLREAVEQYLKEFQRSRRLDLLRQARGMWADRSDLPDFEALRREFDRE